MPDNPTPVGSSSTEGLSERLARLERENAELRTRVAAQAAPGAGAPAGRPARPDRLRSAAAALLVVGGLLLAPVAVVAAWAERELTDTERFVETVGPLASDPVIRSAVVNRLTALVMERAEVENLVHDAVTAIGSQEGIPPRIALALGAMEEPLTSGVESFVRRAAAQVVESDAFETAWVEANRVAHEQMVAVMQGREGNALQLGDEGQLTIQLAGVIEVLKERLVAGGFDVAANIPEVDASFTLVQTTQLVKVQNAYNTVRIVGTWLPWISLGLLAAGVLTARNRSRTLVVAGLGLAISMLALGLVLSFGRTVYLGELTGKIARLDAAEVVFDQIVLSIRTVLRTVAVAGLVVAAAAYFGGGSASARSMRAEVSRAFASSRTWAERRGVSTGPVGSWFGSHKGFVRAVIVSVAGLVILLSSAPTPGLVVGTALVAAALVALLELVARPGPARPADPAARPLDDADPAAAPPPPPLATLTR